MNDEIAIPEVANWIEADAEGNVISAITTNAPAEGWIKVENDNLFHLIMAEPKRYRLEDDSFGLKPDVPRVVYRRNIDRRQFAQGMAHRQWINQEEAIAFVATSQFPQLLQTIIDNQPVAEQFDARMMLLGSDFARTHSLMNDLADYRGLTAEQFDDFWDYCLSL